MMRQFKQPIQTILALMVILASFIGSARSARADQNFDTSLKTTYQVVDSGDSIVNHQFTIKNNQPLLNISQYGLKISSTSITNVNVTQNGKPLKPEVVTTQSQTSIGITFPDKVVGQDKTRVFTISYTDPDVAIVSGKVLEVAIPRLQDYTAYDTYQVEVITPTKFGAPTRVTPANYTSRVSNTQVITTFDRLKGDSVVALFGQEQVFEMELAYHLENPHNGPRLTQIALPPDTPYQKMFFHSLNPLPEKINTDEDGNWIATYSLPANEITTVNLKAQAHLVLTPNHAISQPKPTDKLLRGQEFWEVQNNEVTSIAEQFNSAREIYDYVVQNLSYNYDRLDTNIDRLGATAALQTPDQALCQEFTDAFIALSRARGIPSRRVAGYAHTENNVLRPLSLVQDVLHSWPEYFDQSKQAWIPIDPTWDHTSGGINYFDQFDLNHIVFAINGTSSTTPYPAGSYKLADTSTKDVVVRFGDSITTAPIDLSFDSQPVTLFGQVTLPFTDSITVTNTTGQAYYQVPIQLESNDPSVKLSSPDIITLDSVLPFAHTTIPIAIENESLFAPKKTTITIYYDSHQTTLELISYPRIWHYLTGPEFLITLGGSLFIIAVITGGVLVLRRK